MPTATPTTAVIGRAGVGPATLTVAARIGALDPAGAARAAAAARAAGAHLLLVGAGPTAPAVAGACRSARLPIAAEVATPAAVGPAAAGGADALLVPGRAMADSELLDAVAGTGLPVLLERAPGAELGDWLAAAGRLDGRELVLCERGVAPAGPGGPTLLDLSQVPALRAASGLPVLVDPTATTGDPEVLAALARAATAAGADGVVLPCPAPAGLDAMVAEVREVAAVHGRRVDGARIRYVGAR
jgi:3-deoxy-7-phosphoheptulonate synthase